MHPGSRRVLTVVLTAAVATAAPSSPRLFAAAASPTAAAAAPDARPGPAPAPPAASGPPATGAAAPLDAGPGLDASVSAAESFPVASDFGPHYILEGIEIRGNDKTEAQLILGEIELRVGEEIAASDPRVEAARIRLLSLGYFLGVHLALERGQRRGGAVLVVEVEERGTIILNALHLGSSAATAFWGGMDLAENNFLGRGISVGGGFVASTRPSVADANHDVAARLRALVPPLGDTGLMLTATALASSGSEFYRAQGGPEDGSRPSDFVALRIRRAGGVLGLGRTLTHVSRLFIDFREEGIAADYPTDTVTLANPGKPGVPTAIDFGARTGFSRVGSLTATLDFDTRSDPLVPRAGSHVVLSVEGATDDLGSSYSYLKLLLQGEFYRPVWRHHVVGLHLLAGEIFGSAPIFDRFFVGDLDLFLPPRALGINFSTESPHNWLGSGISSHRFENTAARILGEYSIPVWRRHRLVYSGDFFVAFGAFGLADRNAFLTPGASGLAAWPISLTGDLGLRLDTYIGVFTLSFANALGRLPF